MDDYSATEDHKGLFSNTKQRGKGRWGEKVMLSLEEPLMTHLTHPPRLRRIKPQQPMKNPPSSDLTIEKEIRNISQGLKRNEKNKTNKSRLMKLVVKWARSLTKAKCLLSLKVQASSMTLSITTAHQISGMICMLKKCRMQQF